MKISKPQVIQKNKQTTYQVDVKCPEGNRLLWYSLDESFSDLLSTSCDAPLVGLLIPAMATGEDIYIDGTISDRLLMNLSGPYQSLLRYIYPSLHQVNIYPKDVWSGETETTAGVATGFSGGIDSFCVLTDYFHPDISVRFKVTHLLFNNVGSHGDGGEKLFRERYERLLPAAETTGLPFLMINSNLDSFYSEGFDFQKTHTPRNTSVAFLLQGGISHFMYASTYDYSNVFVGPTYDMAFSDTIALPLLSTDNLCAFSVGSEYTRVEKTLRVADYPTSYELLDVCVNPHNDSGFANCANCWKCLRTLITLEIAGALDSYSASFDLNTYKKRRKRFFLKLLGSRDVLLKEIVRFAKERNFSFPISTYLLHYSRIYSVGKILKKVLRGLRRTKRRI